MEIKFQNNQSAHNRIENDYCEDVPRLQISCYYICNKFVVSKLQILETYPHF